MCFFRQAKEMGYSEYEIAKVKYFIKMIAAEISKLLVFIVIWWRSGLFLPFCVGVGIFLILRMCSGGIHFHSYWVCFFFSFVYLNLCINLLPLLVISRFTKLCSLFFCMILVCRFSPVVSKYRDSPSWAKRKKSKRETFIVIFIYFLFMYIAPYNFLIDIGFWCIVMHTVQLGVAYFVLERSKKHGEMEKELN